MEGIIILCKSGFAKTKWKGLSSAFTSALLKLIVAGTSEPFDRPIALLWYAYFGLMFVQSAWITKQNKDKFAGGRFYEQSRRCFANRNVQICHKNGILQLSHNFHWFIDRRSLCFPLLYIFLAVKEVNNLLLDKGGKKVHLLNTFSN